MNSRKVILLIDSLGTGGAQRQIINLAIGLKKKGLTPLIIYYFDQNFFHEELKECEIETVYIKRKNIFDILFIFRFLKLLKSERAEWLIAYLFMPCNYALFMRFFLTKLKVIVSERSFEQKTKLYEKIFPRMFYFLATYITSNSITQTNVLLKKFPRYSKRIKFIPNGVIDQRWIYNCDNKHLNIVSIGRVSELKQTKLLIEALAIFNNIQNETKLRVLWVGAKYDVNYLDTAYYKECVEMVKALNMQTFWEWTGQKSSIQTILSEASLLVHMSLGEGFPNVVCESMSLGIQVIASRVMDHPNIIFDDFNGYLVEPGDLNSLVSKLNSFFCLTIKDKTEMSKNAYDTAVQSFSLDKMIDSYYNLLLPN